MASKTELTREYLVKWIGDILTLDLKFMKLKFSANWSTLTPSCCSNICVQKFTCTWLSEDPAQDDIANKKDLGHQSRSQGWMLPMNKMNNKYYKDIGVLINKRWYGHQIPLAIINVQMTGRSKAQYLNSHSSQLGQSLTRHWYVAIPSVALLTVKEAKHSHTFQDHSINGHR